MATTTKDIRKELIICVSGGMDSFIAYHYAIKQMKYKPEDILCLNFDIGQPYRKKEQKAMKQFGFPIKTIKIDLIKEELGNVPTVENYIIPSRNMIFATIASGLGKRVWIMGMKYENHKLMLDKNSAFFKNASKLLTQTNGMPTVIESPFIKMTKTDSINWAVENGISPKDLMKTTSCYHPTIWNCGECSLCFKRWVAMWSAGFPEVFETKPWQSKEAKKLVRKYRKALKDKDFTHYSKQRILETLDAVYEAQKEDRKGQYAYDEDGNRIYL